jgi:redox-sensitive bicupin YhaK (pirin superfamily)
MQAIEVLREEQTTGNDSRAVSGIVNSIETLEGGGFQVRRPFPKASFSDFDPFLLLDEMGPIEVAPGEAKGASDHPHRGFETVTYMLSGDMEHRDSRGHAGRLRAGDVQWMTAGAGVVHSEMPSREFARTGGRMHVFQLWVNLPQSDKMIKPRYQEISSSQIPKATSDDGLVTVSVIAGEAMGQKAVIETRTPSSTCITGSGTAVRPSRLCPGTTTPSPTSLMVKDCSEVSANALLTAR